MSKNTKCGNLGVLKIKRETSTFYQNMQREAVKYQDLSKSKEQVDCY